MPPNSHHLPLHMTYEPKVESRAGVRRGDVVIRGNHANHLPQDLGSWLD